MHLGPPPGATFEFFKGTLGYIGLCYMSVGLNLCSLIGLELLN